MKSHIFRGVGGRLKRRFADFLPERCVQFPIIAEAVVARNIEHSVMLRYY